MPTPRKHKDAAACQAAYRAREKEARRLERERKGLPDLPPIPSIPGERRWAAMAREATALFSAIVEEREAYYDDRSDAWRDSEKGEMFQERTDAVNDLLTALDDLDLSS